MEEQLINKIKGGIRGIKLGTKQPSDVIGFLNALKKINPGMHADLINDYIAVVKGR